MLSTETISRQHFQDDVTFYRNWALPPLSMPWPNGLKYKNHLADCKPNAKQPIYRDKNRINWFSHATFRFNGTKMKHFFLPFISDMNLKMLKLTWLICGIELDLVSNGSIHDEMILLGEHFGNDAIGHIWGTFRNHLHTFQRLFKWFIIFGW